MDLFLSRNQKSAKLVKELSEEYNLRNHALTICTPGLEEFSIKTSSLLKAWIILNILLLDWWIIKKT